MSRVRRRVWDAWWHALSETHRAGPVSGDAAPSPAVARDMPSKQHRHARKAAQQAA